MRIQGWLTVVVMFLVSACSTYQTRGTAEQAGRKASEPLKAEAYRIGVDDLVAVNVWRDPELSVSMPVRPDGKITVPLIGDVEAGGRTPDEVATTIRQKLSRYIRNPDVTVILTELRSHEYLSRIRVTGAVENPVSIPYRQGMTALDAVLEAGGTNVYASPDRTRVYRKGKEGTEVIDVRLGRIIDKGDLETNIPLRPGDVVTVPERLF